MSWESARLGAAAASFCVLSFCVLRAPQALVAQSPRERLAAHGDEFAREVITVTDGVHVAVGYALANSILIEGADGVIIVDVLGDLAAAREVRAAFARLTDKPVRAIIYTHNHVDHVVGAAPFAGESQPDIYAHESFSFITDRATVPGLRARAQLQFGTTLPADQFLNAGIGPRLHFTGIEGFIPPNKTFADRLEVEVAGIQVVLQHAPGETDDQLYVWLPERKVLLPGDNFYKAFPNLYAIRGTPYRDVRKWASSLDRMLEEGDIQYLVPSHTRPIVGAQNVREALANYRDAIRFVYDETVAGINVGTPPIELSQQVVLPVHLKTRPYLQEFYGTVPWSVRAIYAGLLGWFDGNATNLFPLSARQQAEKITRLIGGQDRLREAAREAVAADDFQWAAELCDHLLALDSADVAAKELKADALLGLAEQQVSANARNWYLMQAQALRVRERLGN